MSNSASVGQRFSQLIQQLGMSKNAFAMSLDKTATVIQHLVDERNKPGFDLMCKVFEVYPNVSKSWLLMGEGPMLLADANPTSSAASATITEPVATSKPPIAASATPSFPAPLFTVSTARPAAPEVSSPPAEPIATAPQEVVALPPLPAPPAAPSSATALGAAPPEMQSATLPPVPVAPVAGVPSPTVPAALPAALDTAALTAALHAQYLQHQLALAEQRNQHLLEQQQLMQQMLDLMRQNR